MRASERGVDFIKLWEGFSADAYRDVAGIWTIGYGHTGPHAQPGNVITVSHGRQLLKEELGEYEDAVLNMVQVELNQAQFDALTSFTYNLGAGALQRSTMRRRLNAGDYEGAAEALTWWNKARVNGKIVPVQGLTNRREAEARLFLTGAYE